MNIIEIGNFIAKKRTDKGITQNDLANLLNVTHQAVSKWEKGVSMPDIFKLVDLAKILDFQLNDILDGVYSEKTEIHENLNGPKILTIENLKTSAPEMPQEEVSHLFRNLFLDNCTIADIIDLRSYLTSETLEYTVNYKIKQNGVFYVRNLLKYLSTNMLWTLYDNYSNDLSVKDQCVFFSTDKGEDSLCRVDREVIELYNKNGLEYVEPFFRYVSQSTIDYCLKNYVEENRMFNSVVDQNINSMSYEAKRDMCVDLAKDGKISCFNGRFQVLGSEVTGDLIIDYIKNYNYNPEAWSWCGYILEYADRKKLDSVAEITYEKYGVKGLKYAVDYLSDDFIDYLNSKGEKIHKNPKPRNGMPDVPPFFRNMMPYGVYDDEDDDDEMYDRRWKIKCKAYENEIEALKKELNKNK